MNRLTWEEFLQATIGLLLAGCHRPPEDGAGLVESSGIVSVEGARLRYVIEGDGVPCLVLGHSESQRGLLSTTLRSRFRFHFLDLRHDAESHNTLDVDRITLDTYLQEMDAARGAPGLDTTALFGHSHQALLAFECARNFPESVTNVIATACPPRVVWGADEDFGEADASDGRKAVFEQNLRENPEAVLMGKTRNHSLPLIPEGVRDGVVEPPQAEEHGRTNPFRARCNVVVPENHQLKVTAQPC